MRTNRALWIVVLASLLFLLVAVTAVGSGNGETVDIETLKDKLPVKLELETATGFTSVDPVLIDIKPGVSVTERQSRQAFISVSNVFVWGKSSDGKRIEVTNFRTSPLKIHAFLSDFEKPVDIAKEGHAYFWVNGTWVEVFPWTDEARKILEESKVFVKGSTADIAMNGITIEVLEWPPGDMVIAWGP